MLSAFNTKFKAFKSRLPQSSLDSPWRMALFWMVATVVILASFLLMIIREVFKAIAHANDDSNDVLAENERTQAEIDARAAMEGWLSSDPRVSASLNAAEYFDDDDGQWR